MQYARAELLLARGAKIAVATVKPADEPAGRSLANLPASIRIRADHLAPRTGSQFLPHAELRGRGE